MGSLQDVSDSVQDLHHSPASSNDVDPGADSADAQAQELEALGFFTPKRIQPYALKKKNWETIIEEHYNKEDASYHGTKFPWYSGCLVYKHQDIRKRTVSRGRVCQLQRCGGGRLTVREAGAPQRCQQQGHTEAAALQSSSMCCTVPR
jgi:hypothetical protein